MRTLLFLPLFFVLSGCSNTAGVDEPRLPPVQVLPGPLDKYTSVLETSIDPDELATALIGLSRSDSPGALEAWVNYLCDRTFLQRLDPEDPPDQFKFETGDKRVGRVLGAVARLSPDKANLTLVKLGKSKAFFEGSYRERAFRGACEMLRQPSAQLLDVLEELAGEQSSLLIQPLARMRSPLACERIEKIYHSGQYSDSHKAEWFTHEIMEARTEPCIVSFYRRLLVAEVKDPVLKRFRYDTEEWYETSIRNILVQTLFDYLPEQWYDRNWATPPARHQASTKVLEELVLIADLSLKLDISPDAKKSVHKGRKEIDQILAFRRSGAPERIAKAILALDDEAYPVREKATKELKELGESAGPALRKAWRTPLSTEARRRAELLLAQLAVPEREERIAKLIAELDDHYWRHRYHAAHELKGLGELAGPALWNALQGTKSAGTRYRIESLLFELER